MNLRARLLAMAAAGVFLFVAACGGGSDSGSDTGGGSGDGTANTGNTGGNGTSSTCQAQTPTTIVGGDLFVAEQAPVGITLLSNGGLTQYSLAFFYDNVFGIPTNNPQDKWGQAGVLAPGTTFPPGTPVGTSAQVQLQPFTGFVHGEQTPSTFPKGIPIELWLTTNDGNQPGPSNSSSTASIGKDIPHDFWHTASVTYGANNTATVTFFPTAAGGGFSVGLTNVVGAGSPAAAGSGC